jgi:hypothetical protein
VACWWLARLPDAGPFFATCIIGTGGMVGMGLAAQIVLSLFNMYGPKGKVVLVALFVLGAGVLGLIWAEVVKPHLDDETKAKAAAKAGQPQGGGKGNGNAMPSNGEVWGKKLLTGPFSAGGTWSGKSAGGMVRAFFDKETEIFKPAHKNKTPELAQLTKERETEQALLAEWFGLPDDARKKAYEADAWPIPEGLAKAPLTAEFKAGSAVKVKSLLDARCVVCHGPTGEKDDAPMDSYPKLQKYFGPPPAAEKADAPKGVEPIPMAGN